MAKKAGKAAKTALAPRKGRPVNPLSHTNACAVPIELGLYNQLSDFAAARGLTVQDLIRVGCLALLRQGRYHDLTTKLSFGKYAGETVETVVRLDPGYVQWLLANTDKLMVSDGVTALLDQMTEQLKTDGKVGP